MWPEVLSCSAVPLHLFVPSAPPRARRPLGPRVISSGKQLHIILCGCMSDIFNEMLVHVRTVRTRDDLHQGNNVILCQLEVDVGMLNTVTSFFCSDKVSFASL